MAYLVIVLVAGLLQLASGQDAACTNAATAFTTNAVCFNGFTNADGDVICSGTCRNLIDDVLAACQDDSVRIIYVYISGCEKIVKSMYYSLTMCNHRMICSKIQYSTFGNVLSVCSLSIIVNDSTMQAI